MCHTVRGLTVASDPTAPGPDLTHIGARRTLAAGAAVNSSSTLTRWLRHPGTIKQGTLMPNPDLSDEDIAAVVVYLRSLR